MAAAATARRSLDPCRAQRTAARFIAGQRYHAASLIIVVQVNGGRTVSSDPEIIDREESRAEGIARGAGLLATPPGLSDAGVEEAGDMRVLTQPIRADGRQVGTLRVADPLTPVQQAQASLRRTFLVVGAGLACARSRRRVLGSRP